MTVLKEGVIICLYPMVKINDWLISGNTEQFGLLGDWHATVQALEGS